MTTPSPLYRPEVLEARHNRWLGRILIRQPLWHWALTWCVVAFALGIGVFVGRFEYSRTAHVEGRLADDVTAHADNLAGSPRLVAELVVPERLLSTISVGRDVQLRYTAFPYQHFGRYRGRIVSISRTPMPVGVAKDALSSREDSRYIAIVSLERTRVRDDAGDEQALRPGLQVQADVVIETHRLYEWMFQRFAPAPHKTASR